VVIAEIIRSHFSSSGEVFSGFKRGRRLSYFQASSQAPERTRTDAQSLSIRHLCGQLEAAKDGGGPAKAIKKLEAHMAASGL